MADSSKHVQHLVKLINTFSDGAGRDRLPLYVNTITNVMYAVAN